MIQIDKTEVFGWDAAIRGMRNAMNSWEKSDSHWTHIENPQTLDEAKFEFFMGDADLELAKKLAEAGTDHGKFLRMIHVQTDILAPLYWWSQMDTYKVGTAANSCSKMHKIHERDLTMDDFSHEGLTKTFLTACLKNTLSTINNARRLFVRTGDKDYWRMMIEMLPESYNQLRTWDANYAVLRAIYHARKNHKLTEWRDFCRWVESLPYAEELICG